MKRSRVLLFGGSVGFGLGLALAVPAAEPQHATPGALVQPDAGKHRQAESPPIPAYRSSLETYRRHQVDEPMRPWREVNDEVGRLGGHSGHLRGQLRQSPTPNAAQPGAKP